MFDNIGNNLNKIFDSLSRKKFIGEDDLNSAMREIRIALLEADVSLAIAKDFINKVKKEALGQQVIKNIESGQMIVKIVHDQLVETLGSEKQEINLNAKPPIIIMMVGLQGSGKTTSCAKLAHYFYNKHNKKKILLASLDTRRPAAQEQLAILANQTEADSLEIIPKQNPTDISKRALKHAKNYNYDILILDTAGRSHIDEELMNELKQIKKISTPNETILVADALTGQDAINVAENFQEKIGIDGVILTRIDGDSRGGAAITMRIATGCPIKFLGSGEAITELDEFDAQRIADRILGMGDIVSLVEKTAEVFNEKEIKKAEQRIRKGQFDLNDLASQLKKMKKMGGISKILGLLPGAGKIKEQLNNKGFDETEILKQEALILSMTSLERSKPDILNSSRKKRIADGAGSTIQKVNSLLKKYKKTRKMMGKIGRMDEDSLRNMMDEIGGMNNTGRNNLPKF